MPDGRQGYRYSDGSLREANGQLMAKLASSAPTITSDNSRSLGLLRQEKKHQRAIAGANAALRQQPDWAARAATADDDFVEALVEAQMTQALAGEPAYTTKAAEFVMTHTGYAAQKQAEAAQNSTDDTRQLLYALSDLVSGMVNLTTVKLSNVVDAEVHDADE